MQCRHESTLLATDHFSQEIDVIGPADRWRFGGEMGSVPISSPKFKTFMTRRPGNARQDKGR